MRRTRPAHPTHQALQRPRVAYESGTHAAAVAPRRAVVAPIRVRYPSDVTPLTRDDLMPTQINSREFEPGPTDPNAARNYLGSKKWAPRFEAWLTRDVVYLPGGRVPAAWWEYPHIRTQLVDAVGAMATQAVAELERYLASDASHTASAGEHHAALLACVAPFGRQLPWLYQQRVRVWDAVASLSRRHRPNPHAVTQQDPQ